MQVLSNIRTHALSQLIHNLQERRLRIGERGF
jgi:hypothetical protein